MKKFYMYSIIVIILVLFIGYKIIFKDSSGYTIGGSSGYGYAILSFNKLKCTLIFTNIELASDSCSKNIFPLYGFHWQHSSNAGIKSSFGKKLSYSYRYYPLLSNSIWDVNGTKVQVFNAGKKIMINNEVFVLGDNQHRIFLISENKAIPFYIESIGKEHLLYSSCACPQAVLPSENEASNDQTDQN